MHTRPERECAPPTQWNVVPRNGDLLESTAPLELRQRIVAPEKIDEIAHPLRCTYLDCFRYQSVVGGLIAVLKARDDLACQRKPSRVTQHHEADHFALIVRTDHALSKQVAGKLRNNKKATLTVALVKAFNLILSL